jgi:hypothetical protein
MTTGRTGQQWPVQDSVVRWCRLSNQVSTKNMRKYGRRIFVILMAMIVVASITACADMNNGAIPRRQITSCPPGMILTCESRQQRTPSKGGAEEEIPQYDYCRCESDI